MSNFSDDIYTEPSTVDVDTLANLGPLRGMAGIWQGTRGLDIKPKADGPRKQAYVERMELQPIDPVTNGPQLLYGLRYLVLITKPDQVKTYHEQVGYWLWEPATETVTHTLVIPRAQTVMVSGQVKPDATSFELVTRDGQGICSSAYIDYAFKTVEFRIKVRFNPDGSWAYDEDTVMMIKDKTEPFHHVDTNLLSRIGEATPNPLARAR
jgi:hypothetical protein